MNEINNFNYDEEEILKTWIKFIDYYTSMCEYNEILWIYNNINEILRIISSFNLNFSDFLNNKYNSDVELFIESKKDLDEYIDKIMSWIEIKNKKNNLNNDYNYDIPNKSLDEIRYFIFMQFYLKTHSTYSYNITSSTKRKLERGSIKEFNRIPIEQMNIINDFNNLDNFPNLAKNINNDIKNFKESFSKVENFNLSIYNHLIFIKNLNTDNINLLNIFLQMKDMWYKIRIYNNNKFEEIKTKNFLNDDNNLNYILDKGRELFNIIFFEDNATKNYVPKITYWNNIIWKNINKKFLNDKKN